MIQAGWYVRCCPRACGEAEGAGGWLAGCLGVTWVAQHVGRAKPQLSLPEWIAIAVPALLPYSMPACPLYHLTHIHTFPYWAPSASATIPERSRLLAHTPLSEHVHRVAIFLKQVLSRVLVKRQSYSQDDIVHRLWLFVMCPTL